jgi:hypothetical protein
MSDETKTLESHLEEEDWAIIIGNDNKLKGLFIPDGKDEEEVPESIVYILEKYFGIDLADTDDPTFH